MPVNPFHQPVEVPLHRNIPSPQVQGWDPAIFLFCALQNPELHHIMVIADKAASDFQLPNQFFLVDNN